MPRGKQPSGNDTDGRARPQRRRQQRQFSPRAEFAGWVNLTIPLADKPKVDAYNTSEAYGNDLHDLIQAGHKVTLAWDADNECFVATTFMTDVNSPCAGIMVSQRSDDLWRALVKLTYGHAEILPPDYSELVGGNSGGW